MNLIKFYDSIEDYRRHKFRRNLYRALRVVNLLACFAFLIFMMIAVCDEWSLYGEYTALSFIASLAVYGTLSVFAYVAINFILRRIFKEDSL